MDGIVQVFHEMQDILNTSEYNEHRVLRQMLKIGSISYKKVLQAMKMLWKNYEEQKYDKQYCKKSIDLYLHKVVQSQLFQTLHKLNKWIHYLIQLNDLSMIQMQLKIYQDSSKLLRGMLWLVKMTTQDQLLSS